MDTTSLSLLGRAQDGNDTRAWQQLNDIYAPLLASWLVRQGLQPNDIEDIVQETLLAVSKELPAFEHSGNARAFRTWLRRIMVFRMRHFFRTRRRHPQAGGQGSDETEFLLNYDELEDPCSQLTQQWEREHDLHLLARLLAMVEPRFQASTLEAFRRVTLHGESPKKVAEALGMTPNAVVIAKFRVLRELRREGNGLFDA